MSTKLLFGIVLTLALAPLSAYADDGDTPPNSLKEKTVAVVENTIDHGRRIINEGDNILYLSGYAYHHRGTYTAEKIAGFNEQAWGAGFGRTLIDDNGNSNGLFALAFLDSHNDVQAQAGYTREWRWQLSEHAAVGAGFVAMLVSRSDMFNNFPFPAVLPVASVEVKRVALMAIYIPKLSSSEGGNGNVLYLLGRINLGR